MTDITQNLCIYENSVICTLWSGVWEHSEHFKRLRKTASEHCFPARSWVLEKCWNNLTRPWIWRGPLLAKPFLCLWSLFSLLRRKSPELQVRATWALQDKGEQLKQFKLWKTAKQTEPNNEVTILTFDLKDVSELAWTGGGQEEGDTQPPQDPSPDKMESPLLLKEHFSKDRNRM